MMQSKVYGLTGGIAAGKSTVSDMFKEKGINVIDADIISREVYDIYPEIIQKIRDEFGFQYITDNGIDRKKLGKLVFSKEKERKKLESIIIPYIKREIFKKIEERKASGDSIIIVDAPTLFENHMDKDVDKVILVYLDKGLQKKRLIERDKLSEAEAEARINSQLPLEEKKNKSHYIIYNNKDKEYLTEQFSKIFMELIYETKKEN